MKPIVFLGPTLSVDEAREELDAVYRPPVSQGDVYRATQSKPWAIGLVDGYFAKVPAVWHKEILWAMKQGIHVFGSSSMGALRAAELVPFGMIGVGKIFEAFRDGILEDDDEVTVIHSTEETGFRLLSEAMVNIRPTLAKALEQQVISASTHDQLEAGAKAIHYVHRNYPRILAEAREGGAAADELARFEEWLPAHRIDQKRADAISMLRSMAALAESGPPSKRVDFHFQHTDAWDQVSHRSSRQVAAALPDALPTELLLEELRLEGRLFRETLSGALARRLAQEEVQRRGVEVSEDLFRDSVYAFCRERGLLEPDTIRAWLDEQELDAGSFTLYMEREARLRWTHRVFGTEPQLLLDQLRSSGDYLRVAHRAREKKQCLEEHGVDTLDLESTALSHDELLHWFFVEQRRRAIPKSIEGYAEMYGFTDVDGLLQALLREHYYVTHSSRE